jgi:hypothetical protein
MLEIARHDFFKILREEKEIGVKLLWNFVTELSKRLRATSQNLAAAKEQINAVEDLTDALLFEEDSTPVESLPRAPRVPRVPSLRSATDDAMSDTLVPPKPSQSSAGALEDDGNTHTSAVIQRRRVVSITSDPEPASPAIVTATSDMHEDEHERKTDPPPAGEPPDVIDDRPTVVPPEPEEPQH